MYNVIEELNQRINNTIVLFFDLDGTLVDTDYANFWHIQNQFNKSLIQIKTLFMMIQRGLIVKYLKK